MKKPVVHLICNAHLDPVWQWQWEEGCAEAISTFRNAVRLLNEHPGLIFNHNESLLYSWIKKYDPPLFKKIATLVEAGRWCISGGWYMQPDVNLPGTESIIRHISEGRRFFRENFGTQPKVAYNFDSFGHSAGLPQLLVLAGFKMYIHMRPQERELDLPEDLYIWRGADGSEVIGYRIRVGLYHTERDNIEDRISQGKRLALKLNRDTPVFWGIGNHGGGATREDLRKIDSIIRKEKEVEIIHSTTERLYDALKTLPAPVFEGGLQRCFTGCYTSLSRIKRSAQKSLGEIVQTEALSAAGWWLFKQGYPGKELDEAWREHLFNDFHDILAGSCTLPAETDALALYGRVSESIRRLRFGSALAFNGGKTANACIPLTVLNAGTLSGKIPLEFECMLDLRPKARGEWHLRLYTPDGIELPSQEEQPESLLPFNGWRRKISFITELPSCGASHFKLEAFFGKKEIRPFKPALAHALNHESGLIHSLDAGGGRECLGGQLFQPVVIEDKADSWGTDTWNYRKITGYFEPVRGSSRVVEKGDIRSVTESVMRYGTSRIVFQTIAYAGVPLIELRLRITWNEIQRRLKLFVPVLPGSTELLCEIPGGAVSRRADSQEHVHGRWFLVRNRIKGRDTALAVINSGQHGLDFSEGRISLSVLRSAAYCHEKGFKLGTGRERKYMDIGVHEIRLIVTAGDFDEIVRRTAPLADWLSAPPAVYPHLPYGLRRENSLFTFLPTHAGNIRLTACKRSIDSRSLVIRLQETAGIRSKAELKLMKPEIHISSDFKPFEIKTLRIEKNGKWREANMITED